jgi:hypothetical protein
MQKLEMSDIYRFYMDQTGECFSDCKFINETGLSFDSVEEFFAGNEFVELSEDCDVSDAAFYDLGGMLKNLIVRSSILDADTDFYDVFKSVVRQQIWSDCVVYDEEYIVHSTQLGCLMTIDAASFPSPYFSFLSILNKYQSGYLKSIGYNFRSEPGVCIKFSEFFLDYYRLEDVRAVGVFRDKFIVHTDVTVKSYSFTFDLIDAIYDYIEMALFLEDEEHKIVINESSEVSDPGWVDLLKKIDVGTLSPLVIEDLPSSLSNLEWTKDESLLMNDFMSCGEAVVYKALLQAATTDEASSINIFLLSKSKLNLYCNSVNVGIASYMIHKGLFGSTTAVNMYYIVIGILYYYKKGTEDMFISNLMKTSFSIYAEMCSRKDAVVHLENDISDAKIIVPFKGCVMSKTLTVSYEVTSPGIVLGSRLVVTGVNYQFRRGRLLILQAAAKISKSLARIKDRFNKLEQIRKKRVRRKDGYSEKDSSLVHDRSGFYYGDDFMILLDEGGSLDSTESSDGDYVFSSNGEHETDFLFIEGDQELENYYYELYRTLDEDHSMESDLNSYVNDEENFDYRLVENALGEEFDSIIEVDPVASAPDREDWFQLLERMVSAGICDWYDLGRCSEYSLLYAQARIGGSSILVYQRFAQSYDACVARLCEEIEDCSVE